MGGGGGGGGGRKWRGRRWDGGGNGEEGDLREMGRGSTSSALLGLTLHCHNYTVADPSQSMRTLDTPLLRPKLIHKYVHVNVRQNQCLRLGHFQCKELFN